jgi:ribosome-binding protein aMBF1 (putative translation factor)
MLDCAQFLKSPKKTKIIYQMDKFDRRLARVPQDIKNFVGHSMGISGLLADYQELKRLSDNQFAKKLGVGKKELSSFLSGQYDFNLMEISVIEAQLGINIVKVLQKSFTKGVKKKK